MVARNGATNLSMVNSYLIYISNPISGQRDRPNMKRPSYNNKTYKHMLITITLFLVHYINIYIYIYISLKIYSELLLLISHWWCYLPLLAQVSKLVGFMCADIFVCETIIKKFLSNNIMCFCLFACLFPWKVVDSMRVIRCFCPSTPRKRNKVEEQKIVLKILITDK